MTRVQKEVKSYVQIFFSGESGIQGVKIKGLIKMLLYQNIPYFFTYKPSYFFSDTQTWEISHEKWGLAYS